MSALGELLAGVAHELNNPLSVVVGHAMMLREETADANTLRRIDKIAQAAERCTRIVKSFLAMARQEPAVLSPVDPNPVVRRALDAARTGDGLAAEVELRLDDDLPPIMADADQIAQVVLNLVCNAAQAIAASGVGGRIVVSSEFRNGSVEIRVSDDGPGISSEIRGRVFEPFFTTKGEGTGLGLALCHRVVISHRGRIRVDPRPGGGTVFTVRLPMADKVAREPAPSANGVKGPARARILIVEDEADVAELMRDILRSQHHEIDHATTGEAALRLIRKHP